MSISNSSTNIKQNEIDFNNFKFENMKNINTLNNIGGNVCCLKILDDGRLAVGDYFSNLIIYNIDIFKPDIIIKNNLGVLCSFIQLKNKNLACSFFGCFSLKIIKNINDYNENKNQIIKYAHNKAITKIIELKNENLVTFSWDFSFKIWKINNNNNYEQIYEFIDNNILTDGLEIKDNEIICYQIKTDPNSLVFYDLNKNEKIKTLNNLNLSFDISAERTIKLNDNEIVVAGKKKFI